MFPGPLFSRGLGLVKSRWGVSAKLGDSRYLIDALPGRTKTQRFLAWKRNDEGLL